MCASTIFLLARTMRWATVASVSRNALAISPVVNPATARSVSATCASCESAGWQHVKISRRRSSASAASGLMSEPSSSASFSRYRLSRRKRSMARRRAVVISHAPGLSGMPCSGHVSRAASRLSWTTSSAMSKLPMRRTMAPTSLPASSRKTVATVASASVRASVRPSVFHDRPHFDHLAARPPLGHLDRLVEVGHLDDSETSDDLLRLDERAVGEDGLAVLEVHGGRGLGALELLAPDDLPCLRVLVEPLADAGVGGGKLLLRLVLPGGLVVHRTGEHQHVLHLEPPDVIGVPSPTTNGPRPNRQAL